MRFILPLAFTVLSGCGGFVSEDDYDRLKLQHDNVSKQLSESENKLAQSEKNFKQKTKDNAKLTRQLDQTKTAYEILDNLALHSASQLKQYEKRIAELENRPKSLPIQQTSLKNKRNDAWLLLTDSERILVDRVNRGFSQGKFPTESEIKFIRGAGYQFLAKEFADFYVKTRKDNQWPPEEIIEFLGLDDELRIRFCFQSGIDYLQTYRVAKELRDNPDKVLEQQSRATAKGFPERDLLRNNPFFKNKLIELAKQKNPD